MGRIIVERMCIGILVALSALAFFIPFVVTPSTYYPYIFSKIIVFRVLVEVMVMAWIPLLFLQKKYRPRFGHPFILSLSIFFGVLVLTMITGVSPYRSFWASQERMTGVFTMLHFYVWFLMMASVFQKYREWRRLILVNICVAVIVALYGFAQRSDDGRAFSYLGNPIYLATYSMMQI